VKNQGKEISFSNVEVFVFFPRLRRENLSCFAIKNKEESGSLQLRHSRCNSAPMGNSVLKSQKNLVQRRHQGSSLPCSEQGQHSSGDSWLVHSYLEYLQGWKLHKFSGQTATELS